MARSVSVGIDVAAQASRFFGNALQLPTLEGSVVTGADIGEAVVQITAIDGGDAVTPGDSAGTITATRWRTVDGIWHNLGRTTVGNTTITLDPAYEGTYVNIWVQVEGTLGYGQTFVSSVVGIPGTSYTDADVVDATIPVVDAATQILDAVATVIAPV